MAQVRPGVVVSVQENPTPSSIPLDTGTWFVVGTSDQGPANTPTLVFSLDDFINRFGARQSYSVLYDAIETFFQEGGSQVYVSRIVGPAATTGTKNLLDSGAGISLVASALGPGAFSANIKVGVVAGSGSNFQIQVTDGSGTLLEQSYDLPDQQSAVNWSASSNYIRIAIGATALNPAVVSPGVLSTGNDQRGSITDTERQAAIDAFGGGGYGPGQVSYPGNTSSTMFVALKTHAEGHNRVALLDLPDSGTPATIESAAAVTTSRFAAAFCPWVKVPGITAGTTRTVPPSALVAGCIARNDPVNGQDSPAAGVNGQARFAIDITQIDFTDTQRTDLNSKGCNVIRRMFGGIRIYGWRSLVNPITDSAWIDFGNSRLFVGIAAELSAVGEDYVFSKLNDGIIQQYNAALTGICLTHYTAGDLYGTTPNEAFAVDTGAQVNTPTTLANNELHAVVRLRMSPFAEYVELKIVKRSITQAV